MPHRHHLPHITPSNYLRRTVEIKLIDFALAEGANEAPRRRSRAGPSYGLVLGTSRRTLVLGRQGSSSITGRRPLWEVGISCTVLTAGRLFDGRMRSRRCRGCPFSMPIPRHVSQIRV